MSWLEFVQGLKVDGWFTVLMPFGGVAFVLSAQNVPLGGLTRGQWQLITGGVFLYGMGEWRNHIPEKLLSPESNLYSTYIRKYTIGGVCFATLGIILIILGVLQILPSIDLAQILPR